MVPSAQKQREAWQEERGNMRAVANNLILHLHPTRVPRAALRWSYTWGLGGTSALLVVMLVLTGIMLMFRYEPSTERAYSSILNIETQTPFGSLFRAIHHWSANLLVITAFLHFLRVFFSGGFKGGRATNWVIGLLLLGIVLAFNFTGYLLPWDQLAYWAVTVATSLMRYIPLAGDGLADFLLAGPEVGQAALSNFYALHVAVLPVVLVGLLTYHFWRIRKDGGISRPILGENEALEQVTTIPHLVQRELAAAVVVITAVTLFAMIVPAPLGEIADPTHSPNPAKAAWYFMGLQELLMHMHPQAAMSLIALVLLGLLLLPGWDRQGDNIAIYFRSAVGQKAAVAGVLLALYLIPVLVLVDEFWLSLPEMLPGWPLIVANGLLPLAASVLGLAGIYVGMRRLLHATHGEGLVGLFAFVMMALVMLTLVGIFWRGPNMALTLPF